MALYELRTYTLYVGKMAEAVKLYQESLLHKSEDAGFSAASRRHQAGWM